MLKQDLADDDARPRPRRRLPHLYVGLCFLPRCFRRQAVDHFFVAGSFSEMAKPSRTPASITMMQANAAPPCLSRRSPLLLSSRG
jgi:hypothetical protein